MAKRRPSSGPLRLIVCGAAGRMGSRVVELAAADPRFSVAAGIRRGARLEDYLAGADMLVDFSAPAASVSFAKAAARAGKASVIGTTGFSDAQRAELRSQSRRAPLFLAPNFSLGVAVLAHLAAQAARALEFYDAGVWELHHNAKKDAPSGTALALARGMMEARGDGRPVPAVSQRLGGAIGEHTVTLAGPFERLELTHRAQSRALFARGALEAALWLRGRKPGLYGMTDMIGPR